MASPVLLRDASGTANLSTSPFLGVPGTSNSRALTVPATDALELTDSVKDHAKIAWTFTRSSTAADLLTHIDAEGGIGLAGGMLGLDFTTDVATRYQLHVNVTSLGLEGSGLTGVI